MANTFTNRIKGLWSALTSNEVQPQLLGRSTYHPGRSRSRYGTLRKESVVVPIYNRIAVDASSVAIRHVRVDSDDRYTEDMDSSLAKCLWLSPNLDQGPADLIRDAIMTLCEEGVIAIVPVVAKGDPNRGSFDPVEIRVASVVEFYPLHVGVRLYNEEIHDYEDIVLPKNYVAVIENPFYSVMNEQNSTLQRLIRKLHILDAIDEQSGSGKLDILIQLPYQTRTELRKAQAQARMEDLQEQLKNNQLGVAFVEAEEKITQLNRPGQNNLLGQVEYLTKMLYGQLGVTDEIIDGTADESAMTNYMSRTVEPFLTAFTQAVTRTFLTATAITQGQRVRYYRDPFKLVPVHQLAEVVDKFIRNEVASPNDMRTAIGWKPSKSPKADELRNPNITAPSDSSDTPLVGETTTETQTDKDNQNGT